MTPPQNTPLNILVVSPDQALLHEVTWMLDAVGYLVETASDLGEQAYWRRYSLADVLILDGRNIAEPGPTTFAYDAENPTYRIFLYDPAEDVDYSVWYCAGAHDALRIPVSRGELLTRVRTGARFLEFERRMQVQSTWSAIDGMYSRRGLLRKLRKIADDDFAATSHSLLVTSVDWFAGICRRGGEAAGRSLIQTAARAIRLAVGESAVSAHLGDGRFATLLVGQSPAAGKSLAESLAKDFSSRESHHESLPRPTFTSAIVPWTVGMQAERFLSDALETLTLAQSSGGNNVIVHGDINQQFAAWKQEMSTGNPFASVVAQDIMEPFPALLIQGAGQHELVEALRRSGVPIWPFVDHEGRLVGVAAEDEPASTAVTDHSGEAATPQMVTPETIPHDASFPEIYEAFSARGCAMLVVVAGDHPLGYLTFDGFLSLIDPVNAESFAPTDKRADELAYLIVPSTAGAATAESATAD